MRFKAVIFDLDGVIVSTDDNHYCAWKKLADEEGIYIDRKINDQLRGVSRMESLEIVMRRSEREYTDAQKSEMAQKKNSYYKQSLLGLSASDILPGVDDVLKYLAANKIKTAIASSSRNAKFILAQIGLLSSFDAIVDGDDITNSKPDPEVFLKAAKKVDCQAGECLVVEDAYAGVDAAINAGMAVLCVGYAANYDKAVYRASSLSLRTLMNILNETDRNDG